MEVILLHDIERVGHEGDVMKVADGYAHNFLFPRKLAEKSTVASRRALEQRRRSIERRAGEKRDAAQTTADRLSGSGITVLAPVGENGRLHGQVTSHQIAEAIHEQLNITVDRRDVEIAAPIRELGDFVVTARLYKDVKVQIPVHVEPSNPEDLPAEPEPVAKAAAPAPEPEPVVEEAAAEAPVAEEIVVEDAAEADIATE
ncbi:MAG TPA: 50S ribosomal protein L9 [Armatimonadota bacterium]|jgi:large subunit ribosomal protein L9